MKTIAQVTSEEFAYILAKGFNGFVEKKTVNGYEMFIVVIVTDWGGHIHE